MRNEDVQSSYGTFPRERTRTAVADKAKTRGERVLEERKLPKPALKKAHRPVPMAAGAGPCSACSNGCIRCCAGGPVPMVLGE